MKCQLTKMILSTLIIFILSGCDNLVSSVNESKTETQSTIETEECSDGGTSNPVSPLESIKAQGCPIS